MDTTALLTAFVLIAAVCGPLIAGLLTARRKHGVCQPVVITVLDDGGAIMHREKLVL